MITEHLEDAIWKKVFSSSLGWTQPESLMNRTFDVIIRSLLLVTYALPFKISHRLRKLHVVIWPL